MDFQHKSTFVILILEKKQKQTTTELKICHNSDLKITKCTSGFPLVENGLWKTLWKVWKSTLKRGVSAGLLNVLHRVFNLWKKQGRSTACIQAFCGKPPPLEKERIFCPGAGNTSLYPGGASGVEAGNSLEEKTAILWQRKSAYVILQDESISDSVTKTGNFQMQEASFHRN